MNWSINRIKVFNFNVYTSYLNVFLKIYFLRDIFHVDSNLGSKGEFKIILSERKVDIFLSLPASRKLNSPELSNSDHWERHIHNYLRIQFVFDALTAHLRTSCVTFGAQRGSVAAPSTAFLWGPLLLAACGEPSGRLRMNRKASISKSHGTGIYKGISPTFKKKKKRFLLFWTLILHMIRYTSLGILYKR